MVNLMALVGKNDLREGKESRSVGGKLDALDLSGASIGTRVREAGSLWGGARCRSWGARLAFRDILQHPSISYPSSWPLGNVICIMRHHKGLQALHVSRARTITSPTPCSFSSVAHFAFACPDYRLTTYRIDRMVVRSIIGLSQTQQRLVCFACSKRAPNSRRADHAFSA